MDKKTANIIVPILGTVGIILILMMAFNIIPQTGNALLFAGIVCFIVAGLIKKLSKKTK